MRMTFTPPGELLYDNEYHSNLEHALQACIYLQAILPDWSAPTPVVNQPLMDQFAKNSSSITASHPRLFC